MSSRQRISIGGRESTGDAKPATGNGAVTQPGKGVTGTALHVRHRPRCFSELLGQNSIIGSLEKVVKDNRAHTFLFTGPSGTGKTTIARILANSFAGAEATVANIEEIDAATHSGADQMRAVVARTIYRAVGKSPIKTVIVDECQRLSATAWDSLLKPIEEPPKHVYWMLCSTNPGKIPKTIQTRCLRYDLKPVPEEDLLGLLVKVADAEGIEVSDEVIEAIAENSEGSPRQSLVFLEACMFCETANEARAVMRSAGQSKEVVDLARWLLKPQGGWPQAQKLLKGLGDVEAEGVRINIVNYLSKVLLDTKDEKRARSLLAMIECFSKPYLTTDKFGPLLLSVGMAIGLDQ